MRFLVSLLMAVVVAVGALIFGAPLWALFLTIALGHPLLYIFISMD
jgi:hypothetical protein